MADKNETNKGCFEVCYI